jgi:hypothetical protein
MPEKMAKKVSQLREIVNTYFCIGFKKKLINANERGIAALDEDCFTDDGFAVLIGTLATLVDDFDVDVLRSCLKEKYDGGGSINLLEKFLEENNLQKGNVIENLRYIKGIRNTVFPIHRGTSSKFLRLMRKLDFKPPFNWSEVWKKCVNMYVNCLAELSDRLDEYNSRIEYRKGEKEIITKSGRKGSLIYLNDFLYKYRVLVPIEHKHEMETLVNYLTAAVIAYDRKLKSINYALRKYVIPLKDKFTEHAEDIHFVKRRRFLFNDLLKRYGIILSRDDIGIRDDKEFYRYFRYLYAAVVAYQMDITPDWLINNYWGSSWLPEG